MTDNPDFDQKAARFRDLERLRELVHAYISGPSMPFVNALPLMPAAERTEARAILDRLGSVGEPPEKTAERQEMLLRLAETEAIVHQILAQPHYLVRKGKVVMDPQTGQPLSDPAFDRRARAQLAGLERLRSRLTGMPPADAEDRQS